MGDVSSSSFIVAMAHRENEKPIRNEPQLTATCRISRIGEHSWDIDYTVGKGLVMLAMGRTTQVGYNYSSRSTVKLSSRLKKGFEEVHRAKITPQNVGLSR